MPRVLINALASTAGGGITYLRNVLPKLTAIDKTNCYVALIPPTHLDQYAAFGNDRLRIATAPVSDSPASRLLWEQSGLRGFIKTQNIDVLVSLGNFALFGSPIPQILFSRNDLYFSEYFEKDLRARRLYGPLIGHRIKSWIARQSIKSADINVTPTRAFAERIGSIDGLDTCKFEALNFGFDYDLFSAGKEDLSAEQKSRLNLKNDVYRLLYVSHYNYFRNFETLIRALPVIKKQVEEISGKAVQLVLTTDIKRGAVYGGYDATYAADLIDELGIRDDIAMIGGVGYDKLHHLYRLCDAYVCPSYSESFGHPLVEAMASGLPVIAADLGVHREVCDDAALYFGVFDERELASQCAHVLTEIDLRENLKSKGLARSRKFSWDEHVLGLASLIDKCI